MVSTLAVHGPADVYLRLHGVFSGRSISLLINGCIAPILQKPPDNPVAEKSMAIPMGCRADFNCQRMEPAERNLSLDIYFIDGEFVAEDQACIPVNDMGVLRGYGVFDFLRTYHRRPFHLDEHIARLANSAKLIGLALPYGQPKIHDIVMETLGRNEHTESNIRIVVTGGHSEDFITPENRSRLLVMVTPWHPYPKDWYRDGAAIITTHDERYLPGAKSTHYIPGILALSRASQQGAIESIYVDRYGRLLEGTTSNFFAFIDGQLVTPEQSILPGITRDVVLKLARPLFDVQIRDIRIDEIRRIEEAFITASTKEVVPIARMDNLPLSDGRPGLRTGQIMQAFADYTNAYGKGLPA